MGRAGHRCIGPWARPWWARSGGPGEPEGSGVCGHGGGVRLSDGPGGGGVPRCVGVVWDGIG